MKLPVSVFIIAKNEADRIAGAIKSVRDWVEEIIVIDSGSTDDTMKVAESLGAKVLFHSWNGYGLQKRFGEDNCKNRWLINLDADEVITPELAEEIQTLFAAGEPPCTAYTFRIRDLLPGETKFAWFGHTNYQLRLYNREKARFSDSPVHDSVLVREGATAIFKHPVLHHSLRSLAHAIEKMNSYSTAQALDMRKKKVRFPVLRLLIEFKFAFFKAYFSRAYVLRGTRGFTYSVVYAFGRMMRLAKYLELKDLEKQLR